MLYNDFLRGTRAVETPETYSQYQIIEQIYNDCPSMTSEEAYKLWKQTYGKEQKRREMRQRERLEMLLNRDCFDNVDRPHRALIYKELTDVYWAAYYNKDGSRCIFASDNRTFVDMYGIRWILKYDGRYPNGDTIYRLYAVCRGRLLDAEYTN